MHKIYIASPFFNEEQLNSVKFVEELLKEQEVSFYSPRLSGVNFKELSPEQREAASQQVFDDNVNNIDDAMFILACIDDRDTGTSWEIGYGYGVKKPIVTFSGKGYGVNVMLAKSTQLHLDSLDKVRMFIEVFATKTREQDEAWLQEAIAHTHSMLVNATLETNE